VVAVLLLVFCVVFCFFFICLGPVSCRQSRMHNPEKTLRQSRMHNPEKTLRQSRMHNPEKTLRQSKFFLLPYLCLHTVGLVRMEVVWVCFAVLFFISEFHFLFLLIFILFWLVVYICVVKKECVHCRNYNYIIVKKKSRNI
jgi:hypothetical protein